MPVPLLVALGLGAGLFFLFGGSMSSGSAGWTARPGVVLTAAMRTFLDRLAARAALGVVFEVTSGVRSPEAQARSMSGLVRAGMDREEMLALYGRRAAIVEVVTAAWPAGAPWNEGRALVVLRGQVARGIYVSDHMRADAVDISVGNLSASHEERLMTSARELGAEAIRETEPHHIHIEEIR